MFANDFCCYNLCSPEKLHPCTIRCDTLFKIGGFQASKTEHQKKTKSFVISRKRNPPTIKVYVEEASLKQVSTFKYLGVVISGNLTWSTHILVTCCKAKLFIGFLYLNLRDVSIEYLTIVWPVLEYCKCVWAPPQDKYISKLDGVQTFAARLGTRQWRGGSDLLQNVLHWPLLSACRSFHQICMCRRVFFKCCPL